VRKTIALHLAFFLFPVSFSLADTLVRIPNAELSIPFGTVKGEILLAGSYLVFIDEEKPELSFVIPRGIAQDLSSKDDVLTFHLNKSIRDRSGKEQALFFGSPTERISEPLASGQRNLLLHRQTLLRAKVSPPC
jgi:hypothetical protein